MNPEEIKRYFETNPPPKEAKWTDWAYISDTQVFLRSCYTTIRNYNGPLDRCPAWWHLRDFYLLMKKTQQSLSLPETQPQEPPSEEDAAGQTPFEHSPTHAQAEA